MTIQAAVQVLIILLDYGHPLKLPLKEGEGENAEAESPLPYVRADDIDAQVSTLITSNTNRLKKDLFHTNI